MGLIQSLVVDFRANMANLVGGCAQGASSIRALQATATSAGAGIAGALARVGVGLSLGAVFADATAQADRLGEMATVLGDSTENMQALSFAARQNDTDFNSLSGSLTKMQKNIADAVGGNKSLAQTFEYLGLNLRELSIAPASEQFAQIADALGRVEDPASRAKMGMDLFGRSYAEIAVLAGAGSGAIVDARARMEELGITLTGNSVSAIKAFNDKMAELRDQLAFTGANVISKVTPAIVGMVNGIQQGIAWVSKLSGTTRDLAAAATAAGIAYKILNSQLMLNAYSSIIGMVGQFAGAIRTLTTAVKAGTVAQVIYQAVTGGWLALVKVGAILAATTVAVIGVNKALESATEETIKNSEAAREQANAARDMAEGAESATAAMKAQEEAAKSAQKIADIMKSFREKREDAMFGDRTLQRTIEQMRELGATVEQIEQVVADAQAASAFERQADAAEKISGIIQGLKGDYDKLTMSAEELLKKQLEQLGANEAQVEAALQLQRMVKDAENQKKQEDDAKKRDKELRDQVAKIEKAADPMKAFREGVEELQELQAKGLSSSGYEFQLNKLMDDYMKSSGNTGISKGQTLSSGMSLDYYRDAGRETEQNLLRQAVEELRKGNNRKLGVVAAPWDN